MPRGIWKRTLSHLESLRNNLKRAQAHPAFGNQNHLIHGQARDGRMTPERRCYNLAKQRCINPRNPKYPRYGGRGIEFRFSSFQEFFSELGKRPSSEHSIDRINNDGHYEKGNVRWATPLEQAHNK